MARKRMFSLDIVDSDAFLDMPISAQCLYYHLNMRADDDGFISSPKKVMRIIGSNQNDLDVLLAKRYILPFDSNIVVVKHWKVNNTIRKDRYKETLYKEEKALLIEKENGAYTEKHPIGLPYGNQMATKEDKMATKWQPQPNGNQGETNGRHSIVEGIISPKGEINTDTSKNKIEPYWSQPFRSPFHNDNPASSLLGEEPSESDEVPKYEDDNKFGTWE